MNPTEQQLQRAVVVHKAGDYRHAEELYRQIVAEHPLYAAAWEHLGGAYADQEQFDKAIECYEQVLTIDPRHASALNNLGNVLLRLTRRREAIEFYDRALAIQPGFVSVHLNKANLLLVDGHIETALHHYEQALRHAPHDPDIHKNVGIARLMLGDFAGGWPEWEWRYQANEPALPAIGRPLWDGSALYGKTLLLIPEPGLGDDVQFIRYAVWLKQRYKCRILFACRPKLRQLLSTCAGIDGWLEDMPLQQLPPFDYFAPFLRLPAVLGHTLRDAPGDVPYLTADSALTEQWKQRLSAYRGRKIGIHWRVGHVQRGHLRMIPLNEFAPLSKIPGVQLFSLQKGPGSEEIANLPAIVDLGRNLDENTGAFVETAAVLKNLDLLITCDTAIAHVAGALGVPVWVGLNKPCDWRWSQSGDSTVWYPSMRLFRQTTPGDWTPVMKNIEQALTSLT